VLKCEKRKKHLYGHHSSSQNAKMDVGEDEVRLAILKDLKSRGQINFATHIYKNVTIDAKLQKCHYWASNVGPFT